MNHDPVARGSALGNDSFVSMKSDQISLPDRLLACVNVFSLLDSSTKEGVCPAPSLWNLPTNMRKGMHGDVRSYIPHMSTACLFECNIHIELLEPSGYYMYHRV